MSPDVAAGVAALIDDPIYLLGVRHHSPSLARVLPQLLDAAGPDALVIELPAEADEWVQWIGHPEAVAPLAFAVAGENEAISFYPFADFSPELVALRWAQRNEVPVECADLSAAAMLIDDHPTDDTNTDDPDADDTTDTDTDTPSLPDLLNTHVRAEHSDDVWDRLVEVPSAGAAPEAIRRSALAVGWAYRQDQPLNAHTAAREAAIRQGIRRAHTQHGPKVAAVTGAWHSPALTAQRVEEETESDLELLKQWRTGDATASLVPYSEDLLDSRSGYPSGIRDPRWQQTVLTLGGEVEAFEGGVVTLLTRMAAGIRAEGHPCGPAEIREAHRLTLDLAALRELPVPGRRELLEACTTVFAQGEVLGRGRVVARVAEKVLVGDDKGSLAPGTPRSGLAPAFEKDLKALRLPGPGEPTRELTLEPLRLNVSDPAATLDTNREIFLQRCRVAGIAYASRDAVAGVGGAQAVSTRWTARYSVATEASLARTSHQGVTVEQAAAGALRLRRPADNPDPAEAVRGLADASAAGLPEEFDWWLALVARVLPTGAGIEALTDAIETVAAIGEGSVAGMLGLSPQREDDVASAVNLLADAAVAQVVGLGGSDDAADAIALGRLAALRHADLGLRLTHTLRDFVSTASPLMQGAATALLHRLGHDCTGMPSIQTKIRGAATKDARTDLRQWLIGFIAASPELVTDDPDLREDLRAGVEDTEEAIFINRLPALRGGFDPLSAAERERLLQAVGADRVRLPDVPAEELGRWAEEDLAAWERLQRLGLTSLSLSPQQRWALVLGRRREELDGGGQRRLARSLDQLYGNGDGEGSAGGAISGGAGNEPSYPTAREWADDLDALFGEDVREDIAAAAVSARNPLGMDLITGTQPRASVELLSDVLSLAGGMPESMFAKLRPMLKRMVAELSQALATKLRPALRGLQGWRPTTRPSPRLDAVSTIRRNLRHAVPGEDGSPQLVIATPIFRQPIAKRAEWDIIVLVDVSGSMEPSTVFAALTSSILAGVDALSVTFLAFSTEVIDLSDHVDDPLSLLLEIKIGGGTNIAGAVAVAQEHVKVPSRTMLVLISDFDEWGSGDELVARVGALNDSGVKLLGCAALDDTGNARYNAAIASQVAGAGMAVSAVSPTALARWVAEQVQG